MSARAAFPGWSNASDHTRGISGRGHHLVVERTQMLAEAISLEMGSATEVARRTPVPLAAEHVRVARDVVSDYQLH
ncbi:hypothetical protein CO663_08725 [Rhizobium anhuiense]|nr:hypothetical protein CO663_08725 [Rhizobium anhuiense]